MVVWHTSGMGDMCAVNDPRSDRVVKLAFIDEFVVLSWPGVTHVHQWSMSNVTALILEL